MPFLQEIRHAGRVLSKSPAATAVAVLALALGIGVNTSAFISANAILLQPLPFPRLDRIVSVWETAAKAPTARDSLAPANFLDWQSQSRSFAATAAYQSWDASLTGSRDPIRVSVARVSPGFFTVLGIAPEMGRTLLPDDDRPAHSRIAIVSDGFWRRQLAATPGVVGHAISLNGEQYTVVGVMPDNFDFPLTNSIWVPLVIDPASRAQRVDRTLSVLALLNPGVPLSHARQEASSIAARLQAQYPLTNRSRGFGIVPLRELADQVTGRFIVTLLGAAGFVLLLACANVGNLELARAAARGKEIAVRAALGASRFQIARQLLEESLLISSLGAILALLLASWYLAFTKATIPPEVFTEVAGLRTMDIDTTVISYTIALSLVAGLLCSLPGMVHLLHGRSRLDLNDALKEGGRASLSSSHRSHLQSLLVVSEVALALVLLTGAGFMVKMFNTILTTSYGYQPKHLLRLKVSLPAGRYQTDTQARSFFELALARFQTLSGAQSSAVWSEGAAESLSIEGRPPALPGDLRPEIQSVSPGFLQAMEIPLIDGRFFNTGDRASSAPVIVLSQSVARHYWPNANPIGAHVRIGSPDSPWLTVAGVSADIVQDWFTNRPALLAYIPFTQAPLRSATFLLRTIPEPASLAPSARAQIRSIDKDLPVYAIQSMERFLLDQTSGVRAAANSMTIYAAIALLLAATGIFAVVSYLVVQRTRDIGVRMALGARSSQILAITLGRTLRTTGVGLMIGIPAAFSLLKLMSSLLYNVVRLDWLTFAACTALLVVSAFCAAYLPARRASKIDPILALREQ